MKNPVSELAAPATLYKNEACSLVFHNIPDAIVLIDQNLNIVTCNQRAKEDLWTKLQKEITPGMAAEDLVSADKRVPLKALAKAVLNGLTETIENQRISESGEKEFYETTISPARDESSAIVGILVRSLNVTQKKKAELAVQEAEERWQFALEAANQAAWDWNLQTNKIIYSSSYQKMYGFVSTDLSNEVSEWHSRIHPDDRKKLESDLEKHLQSKNPYYETTYRIQLKNGCYKWILARGKLIEWDLQGKPLRMIGIHTDLTETLKAEEEIRKMNERFVYASKASAQALWEWDAVTGQAYVSPSFSEIFGWQADESNYFEQWHQYVHPEDKKETISSYYHTLEKTTNSIWEASYRFLKKDGSYAIVTDKAYILRDEAKKAIKVIGATQDVTDQKRTEEELSRSNERFNLMMEATSELLWEWDIQSNQIYRSKQGLKKVYGLDDDFLIKTHEQWLNRIHPEDLPKVNESFAEIFNCRQKQVFEIEYRFLNGDNTYHHLRGCGILLPDEKGNPVRIIGTEQDITERKTLEQELLRNELEYKKLINQATVDSQEQERGEIGRELHDNINQVLTTTKLYLELALSNQDIQTELVKKASKNISTIINEIRQLSRSLMDPTLGDLGVVESIKDLIENINLTRKLDVSLQIDEAVENLLERKQKLTTFRIVQESLNNVIRHANAKQARITIFHRNEKIYLTIVDDGIGFSPDFTKKGAGLKNITNRAYLINGEFHIKSKPGHGCEINICFPINNQQH